VSATAVIIKARSTPQQILLGNGSQAIAFSPGINGLVNSILYPKPIPTALSILNIILTILQWTSTLKSVSIGNAKESSKASFIPAVFPVLLSGYLAPGAVPISQVDIKRFERRFFLQLGG